MVKRRAVFNNLPENYLFPEINKRKNHFLERHPDVTLINLGIGDTVMPLPEVISEEMQKTAALLATKKGYKGYGSGEGLPELREKISKRIYNDIRSLDEIFVSDGAKCDVSRLQMFFGREAKIALQDPAYPVYLEGSLMQGVEQVSFMSCSPANDFFPDLNEQDPPDLLYICNPNNPTGVAYTHAQLKTLVDYARLHRVIILFDVAYTSFIQDASYPRSIYEISGAEEVAIEIGSFSKMAGFTGVRLGWTAIPKALCFDDGSSVWKDWRRMMMTVYNGTSYISQQGGIAALSHEGGIASQKIISGYLENAARLKTAFQDMDYRVYGGQNAPYLWVYFPERDSWDVFQEFLEEKHLIVTPGGGYGPSGKHFIRVSSFAQPDQIEQAIARLCSSNVTLI